MDIGDVIDMSKKAEIIASCFDNLVKNRAVATGIGLFALVIDPYQQVLMRMRAEKGSLYGQDLSGNWELPGGGVDLDDFPEEAGNYQGVVFNTLARELQEETGLLLSESFQPILLPAWLRKDGLIDLAFVTVIGWDSIRETEEFAEKHSAGEVEFFSMELLKKEEDYLNIVSLRMRFLVQEAINSVFCQRGLCD